MNGIKKRYETQKLMIDREIRDVEIYRVPELLKQVPGQIAGSVLSSER